MTSNKRQRTTSPEEERHHQSRLEETLQLVEVLQQQLLVKENENHSLRMNNEALRREAIPYAREMIVAREEHIERQNAKIEELVIENNVLTREKNKAQSEVRRQTENTMQLMEEKNVIKEELESRSYQIIQLKRDAECYSRYFAQVDDEYEGLRAQIRKLESAQQVAHQERTVILVDDSSELDEDDEGEENIEDIEDDQGDNIEDMEYEELKAQIYELESALEVDPQERTVVLMDDNSEPDEDVEDGQDGGMDDTEDDQDDDIEDIENGQDAENDQDNEDDQDAEDEFGDLFDFGDHGSLLSDEMDEFYDASEEPMDDAEEEYENRQ